MVEWARVRQGEEADEVKGFKTGANDYVQKPFSPRILIARINAILNRSTAQKEKDLGAEIPGNASYTEVIVAKNRAGQTGTARLFFYKDYVRFDSPSKEWEDAMNAIANED